MTRTVLLALALLVASVSTASAMSLDDDGATVKRAAGACSVAAGQPSCSLRAASTRTTTTSSCWVTDTGVTCSSK